MRTPPVNDQLRALLEKFKGYRMSPAERREQAISWAVGQAALANPGVDIEALRRNVTDYYDKKYGQHELEMRQDMLKIYVAGASAELERARVVMEFIYDHPRMTLVRDWVKDIEIERVEGGRQDSDLTQSEQAVYARKNLGAIADSDVLWLLSPPADVHTTGAWVELGAALVTGHVRQALGLAATVVIVSGLSSWHYLFNSLADQHFETDAEAIDWLNLRCSQVEKTD